MGQTQTRKHTYTRTSRFEKGRTQGIPRQLNKQTQTQAQAQAHAHARAHTHTHAPTHPAADRATHAKSIIHTTRTQKHTDKERKVGYCMKGERAQKTTP